MATQRGQPSTPDMALGAATTHIEDIEALEDMEDAIEATRILARVRSGEEPLTDFEDWETEYEARVADGRS